MCGRFAKTVPESLIAREWFNITDQVGDTVPRYNVAPGTQIPAFRAREGSPEWHADGVSAFWGFRPPWADDNAPQPINARAEKVAHSNYFRSSFAKRRCLIPATGWYEWRATDAGKQPYFITLRERDENDVLFLAGIYTAADAESGEKHTAAILTEPASSPLAFIHERQPVVLDPECRWEWLDPERTEREAIRAATQRLDPRRLTAYPVSKRVNRPENDDESLLEKVSEGAG